MSFKKFIPKYAKLYLKVFLRHCRDLKLNKRFANKKRLKLNFEHRVSLQQEIRQNENFENKIANINLGIKALNQLVIYPNEIFSFWKLISKPNSKNGYKMSRNIIDGKLTEDYGGGLCQLSSIIYHCSLISGLKTIERHNHSVDLYNDEERFTPLGSDATIVYGYKDLRFQNTFDFPIQIEIQLTDFTLECSFSSPSQISKQQIEFAYRPTESGVEVKTFSISDKKNTLLNKAHYLKLK